MRRWNRSSGRPHDGHPGFLPIPSENDAPIFEVCDRSTVSMGFIWRTPGYRVVVASTSMTWLLALFEDFDDSLVALDNDVAEGASAR